MEAKVIYFTIIVKNLKESVDFYKNVFGLKEGYHVDFPFGGLTIMNSSGASIELIEGPQFPLGFYSVAIDVENLDDAIEEIKSKGGTFFGEIIHTGVGRHIFLQDNNQNRICLMEHSKIKL